jgi:hypothetical protein
MSVSIEVERGKPFQISAILPKVEKALKLILGLTYDPKAIVDVVRTAEGETGSQESAWIRPGMEDGFFVTLGDVIEDSFYVTLREGQPLVSVHSREGVDYFAIIPEKWWSKALGAAVAIAIAEHSESEVRDTQGTYTLKEYMKPYEFAQSIKVDKVFDDINEATEYFSFRLPGAVKKESEEAADNGPL